MGTLPKVTLAAISVREISKDAILNFGGQRGLFDPEAIKMVFSILQRGYIQNLKVDMVGDKIKLEARVYRTQRKREKPHLVVITTADNNIKD